MRVGVTRSLVLGRLSSSFIGGPLPVMVTVTVTVTSVNQLQSRSLSSFQRRSTLVHHVPSFIPWSPFRWTSPLLPLHFSCPAAIDPSHHPLSVRPSHAWSVLLTPGQSFTRSHSPLHHLTSHPSKDEWTYASRNHFIFNTVVTQLIPWSLLPPSSSPFARSQQDRRLGGEGCRAREFRATTDPLHLSTAHGHVASTQHGVSFSLSSVRERPVTARLRDSVRTPES
jgi:hypothetical protein